MSRSQIVLAALILWGRVWRASADTAYYLDVNGAGLGSGVTNGGVYDAGGTNWSTDSTGESGTTTDQTVSHGGTLIFSAGTDAAGTSYTVDGSAGQTQGGIAVQDGNVNFTATGSFFGGGTVLTAAGTSLNFNSSSWDFYAQTMIFDAAAGTTITLNSISTTSGRNGGITKTDSGLLVITGAASARTIAVNVNGGELRIANANALYTSAYPPPSHTYTVTVTNPGSLELSNNISVANNPITLSGSGYNNLGALNSCSGANTYASLITLAGDARINAAAGATLTLAPASGSAVTGRFNLTLGGDGNLNVSQPIDSATSLTKDGNGTVTFSAPQIYPGPTTNSAGTLRFVETAGVLGGVTGGIVNNATLIVSNAAAQNFTNLISGGTAGQLVKQGAGTLTLTSANPYSGATVVSAGKLALAAGASIGASSLLSVTNGAILDVSAVAGFTLNTNQTLGGNGVVTGAVTCVSGATVSPGATGAAGTLTFANPLTLAGGTTAVFALSPTTNGANAMILVYGNAAWTGTNFIFVNYTTLANGAYPLLRATNGGVLSGNVANLVLAGFIPARQVAGLQTNAAGTELDLVVSTNAHAQANLTWTGNGGNNLWDVQTTVAWRNGAMPAVFYQYDRASLDDTGASNPMVSLTGALAPASATVNAIGNYTFAGGGSLIGATSLVKSNSGLLTITTTNTFTGGTLIAGGSVQIANAAALGAGPVTNNAALVFAPAGTLNFSNVICGSGSLTNLAGTLVLSGSNGFTGAMVVSAGVLQLGNAVALGATSGATVMSNGAMLDLNGLALGAEPITLNGGALTNSSAQVASLTGVVTLADNSTVAGVGDLVLSNGIGGGGALTKSGADTLTLAGTSGLTGPTTVAAGALLVNGVSGPGAITVNSGATLGGGGVIRGAVTNQSGGTLAPGTLVISNALVLQAGSSCQFQIAKPAGVAAWTSISGLSSVGLGGTLNVSVTGQGFVAGDSFQLVSANHYSGAFAVVNLPYLYGNLLWDTSGLSTGVVRVITLPAVSTFAQRQAWAFTQAMANPGSVSQGFILAEAYFASGNLALGQSTARAASLALTNNTQDDFQVLWAAMDCYTRFNALLDSQTKSNIEWQVTQCDQYAGTVTSNLKTLGHVIRYLGSEAFGEAAFASNAIWTASDPNAYNDTLNLLAGDAKGGFGEFASRPYAWFDWLPSLSLAQLARDPTMRQHAMLAFQAGLAQYAPYWMRGHIGAATTRSYPDEYTQQPFMSANLMWLYFGGDVFPGDTTDPVFGAVMNYQPLPVIQMAATNRSTPYLAQSYFNGAQQHSYLDDGYALFSDGPASYGNFQVYGNGVMWTDPNLAHYAFLWLAKPWVDDPASVSVSHPHGRNTGEYKEGQKQDSVAYVFDIPATETNCPYALGYVPGGWQAAINESSNAGRVFLHFGSVMIAIQSEVPFLWNTNSGIYAPATGPMAGDSEFRVWGVPLPAAMQSIPNLANSYLGVSSNEFAMAVETARPDLYPGATPADQLAAFRSDIINLTGLSHANGSPPTAYYTNRHGNTISVLLSANPAVEPIALNGVPVNDNNWPMIQNPWMWQDPSGSPLVLTDGTNAYIYDFNAWTLVTNTAPPAPSGLTATLAGRVVNLSWNTASNAMSYNLKRAACSTGPFATIAGGLTATNFSDRQFPGGGIFYYAVSAVNYAGEGTNSLPVGIGVPANYFAAWPNRCAISFSNYTAAEILSNFPALVILGTNLPGFSYPQFASPAGGDLRFSDATLNQLNYEVESWNTNGSSYAWVQVPALASNTVIYAWWGNWQATNPAASTTNGAVWNGNYAGVWHLNQTPSASESDSTTNRNAATPVNLTSASLQPGICGGSLNFNGTNSALNIPSSTALGLLGGQFTLSAWVNLNQATNGVILGKGQNGSVWYSWFLSVGNNPGVDQVNPANRLCVGLRTGNSSGDILATQTANVALSNWVQVAGTLDGANLNLYVNGQLNAVTATTAIPFSNSSQLWGGADSGRDYLNGRLDELRVENVSRSPSWLAAVYQNIASNAVFNSYAPVATLASSLTPTITAFNLAGDQPGFLLGGAAGFTYTVQASTNLLDWQNIYTNAPGALPVPWTDTAAGGFAQRYYRILLGP